jgi:hypothetical protein
MENSSPGFGFWIADFGTRMDQIHNAETAGHAVRNPQSTIG